MEVHIYSNVHVSAGTFVLFLIDSIEVSVKCSFKILI